MAEIVCDLSGAVAHVQMARPEQRNAMSSGLVTQMISCLQELTLADSVRAIVLSGTGKGFCAGSDLTGLSAMTAAEKETFEAQSGLLARMFGQCPKPIIASVHGFAIGGGLTLAAACDIVVTTADSRWSLPEVPIGLFPAWGISHVTSRVGMPLARRLCWGIETLTGEQAVSCGLADMIDTNPLEHAMALAEQLGQLPRYQSQSVKLYFGDSATNEAADLRANHHFMASTRTAEALASFEKFGRR